MVDVAPLLGSGNGNGGGGSRNMLHLQGYLIDKVAGVSVPMQRRHFDSLVTAHDLWRSNISSDVIYQPATPSKPGRLLLPLIAESEQSAIGLSLVAGTTYNGLDAVREGHNLHKQHWARFLEAMDTIDADPTAFISDSGHDGSPHASGRYGSAGNFLTAMRTACAGRSYICTEAGLRGLAPSAARVGDVVAILYGGKWPFVLRPVEDEGAAASDYYFVGPAYVHGAMHGEALGCEKDCRDSMTFILR